MYAEWVGLRNLTEGMAVIPNVVRELRNGCHPCLRPRQVGINKTSRMERSGVRELKDKPTVVRELNQIPHFENLHFFPVFLFGMTRSRFFISPSIGFMSIM